MENMLWLVDKNQDNMHVLCATLAEKVEIMDKKMGHLNKLAV